MTTTNVHPHTMPDVQNRGDVRGLAIDQVGITDLKCPIIVLDRLEGRQSVTASLSMSVGLPHHFKGTHMSRFVEVLNEHRGEMTLRTLPLILRELQRRLHAESAQLEVRFAYFLERTAPVSGSKALMDYTCMFKGRVNGGSDDFVVGVDVPVSSLCPCSKEISDYGAHNQRGHVKIRVRSVRDANKHPQIIWIEDLIEMAEHSASAPVYPLLKRVDERHVTMQAYDNPAFVEDIARSVATKLIGDKRVASFNVRVVNHESIHNHNAFAILKWTRP